MTTTTAPAYRVLGTTDDVTTCQVCVQARTEGHPDPGHPRRGRQHRGHHLRGLHLRREDGRRARHRGEDQQGSAGRRLHPPAGHGARPPASSPGGGSRSRGDRVAIRELYFTGQPRRPGPGQRPAAGRRDPPRGARGHRDERPVGPPYGMNGFPKLAGVAEVAALAGMCPGRGQPYGLRPGTRSSLTPLGRARLQGPVWREADVKAFLAAPRPPGSRPAQEPGKARNPAGL